MVHSDQSWVVVGGRQPRLTSREKLPLFERGYIFPFVIACETAQQAQSLHPALTNTLVSLGLPEAHNNPASFAHNIFHSSDIDALEVRGHTKWYPLFRDAIPQIRVIYMRHSDLSIELNDTTYSKFRRYRSLKLSLIFMVLSGDEGEMRSLGYLGDETPGISHAASPVAVPPPRRAPRTPLSPSPGPPDIPASAPRTPASGRPRAPRTPASSLPHLTSHLKDKRVVEVSESEDEESTTSPPLPSASMKSMSYPDRHALRYQAGSRSPAQPITASSSGGSRSIMNDTDRDVWSYMRNLGGIVGILYRPVPTSQQSTSLGALADDYLLAHGYTSSAVESIASIASSSFSCEEFVGALATHGFARTEAEFLWRIVDHRAFS